MTRMLSVSHLLANGFKEVGCWTAFEQRLSPPAALPTRRGVYAFAIGRQVFYVGLASRSLKQRLGFYARPGVTQRTNQRLNEMIRNEIANGSEVRVLMAQPADTYWNGFRISGPEGLEAALIEDFDLPWNVRGSSTPPQVTTSNAAPDGAGRRAHGSVPTAVTEFVAKNPGCTELQIARGVFGRTAVQPQANSYCRKLVERGVLERLPTRPFTYLIKDPVTTTERTTAGRPSPLVGSSEHFTTGWTPERLQTLSSMWEEGHTPSEIADALGGVSRNAVIGRAHRMGLRIS